MTIFCHFNQQNLIFGKSFYLFSITSQNKITLINLCLITWIDLSVLLRWTVLLQTHCIKSAQIRSFFWSVFSCIRTDYGDLLRKSSYSVRIQENMALKKIPYSVTFHAVRQNPSIIRFKRPNTLKPETAPLSSISHHKH